MHGKFWKTTQWLSTFVHGNKTIQFAVNRRQSQMQTQFLRHRVIRSDSDFATLPRSLNLQFQEHGLEQQPRISSGLVANRVPVSHADPSLCMTSHHRHVTLNRQHGTRSSTEPWLWFAGSVWIVWFPGKLRRLGRGTVWIVWLSGFCQWSKLNNGIWEDG